MEIVINPKTNTVDKAQIEQVQQQQQEYKLIGTHLRTPGLKIFQYNHHEDKVVEIDLRSTQVLRLDDNLNLLDSELRCEIDGRYEIFESLNMKNALKRVANWKQGKVKYLFNLRKPGELKFF